MALFGAPLAHKDDPARAVRAAFAVRDAVAELAERQPERPLQVRIGVTTGEALVDLSARPELLGFPATYAFELLDRTDELAALLEQAVLSSRSLDAARDYVAGRRVEAADVIAASGSLADEAYARRRAAEVLVAEGRRAEADVQLGASLAFFRGVGATRFVCAGEHLLPASA